MRVHGGIANFVAMNLRVRILLLLISLPLCLGAQRQAVVVNMETGVPVRDIIVYTDRGESVVSAWDGSFTLRDSFTVVRFSNPNFEKRTVLLQELTDTVALLPSQNTFSEVEVWGKRKDISQAFRPDKTELQLQQPVQQGFNILGLLGYFLKKDRPTRKERRRQRHQELLDSY